MAQLVAFVVDKEALLAIGTIVSLYTENMVIPLLARVNRFLASASGAQKHSFFALSIFS